MQPLQHNDQWSMEMNRFTTEVLTYYENSINAAIDLFYINN